MDSVSIIGCKFKSEKLIFDDKFFKCIFGYNILFFILHKTLAIDANPEDASVCPILLLIEPIFKISSFFLPIIFPKALHSE